MSINMKLCDLLADSLPQVIYGDPEVDIRSLAYDSRRVEGGGRQGEQRTGTAFFALKGLVDDGIRFMPNAVDRGAVACIADRDAVGRPAGVTVVRVPDARRAMAAAADRFHGSPSRKLSVVGVTGTNGKTTTTFMVESILTASGSKSGLLGTIRYRVGDSTSVASRTTPESIDLQAMLHDCLDAGCTHVAMEVSSHALEMQRVQAVRFAAAVFTNLTQDHLDFHGDMTSYLRAKLKLFESLDSDSVAVINRDSTEFATVAASTRARVLSYGLEPGADVTVERCDFTMRGFRGLVRSPWGSFELSSPMTGRFNVHNALAAVTAACGLGVPPEAAVRGIAALSSVPGRFETIACGNFTTVVDYAHTPDALENILSSVRAVARGRIIAVFGCGGDRDRRKRPLMAAAVARHADRAILTSDNPRSEPPEAIMDEAEQGFGAWRAYRRIVDRKEAILAALADAQEGDVVVIAGKGHEDYQIFKDRTIHFSDREVVEGWSR